MIVQSLVSIRRIEKYLQLQEIVPVPTLEEQANVPIRINKANIGWTQSSRDDAEGTSTPHHDFLLVNVSLEIPKGELTLICGKFGSGKTLLLLGESRTLESHQPPDSLHCSTIGRGGSGFWSTHVPSHASERPCQLLQVNFH